MVWGVASIVVKDMIWSRGVLCAAVGRVWCNRPDGGLGARGGGWTGDTKTICSAAEVTCRGPARQGRCRARTGTCS